MIEKRFTFEHESGIVYIFNDYLKGYTHSISCYDELQVELFEEMVNELNSLSEDNIELKQQLEYKLNIETRLHQSNLVIAQLKKHLRVIENDIDGLEKVIDLDVLKDE